jgi:UDP:flavonoid glycosyltransferase YjiC (YdhE family)
VLPLFSIDQHLNADAVEASGVGVVVREPSVEAVASSVSHVLSQDAVQSAAARVAAELQALPPASAWLSR